MRQTLERRLDRMDDLMENTCVEIAQLTNRGWIFADGPRARTEWHSHTYTSSMATNPLALEANHIF